MNRMSMAKIVNIATWWKNQGGAMRVEVAALEPLLWKEGALRVANVVKELKSMGYFVSMTSNGSALSKHANSLSLAGLDLLRLSWHSNNPECYRKITGGGDLHVFMDGLNAALECGINLSINRVLMRGYLDDLKEQVDFIDKFSIRLKLLDLYWTPESADEYDSYYISPEESIASYLPRNYLLDCDSNIGKSSARQRKRFLTPNNGVVEFKLKNTAAKTGKHCDLCTKKSSCLEGFADYFRVFPDGTASLCYLRTDLALPIYNGDIVHINEFVDKFPEVTQHLATLPLRLVLEGRCNYNCGFPSSAASWCLKQGRGFDFPDRSWVLKS